MNERCRSLGFRENDAYRCVPEDRIVSMLMLGGFAYEGPSAAATKASADALESWTQRGLGFRRGAHGGRLFDQVEVENFMRRAGLQGQDEFWAERYVATGRRLVTDLAATSRRGAAVLDQELGMALKRTFNLQGVKAGSRLRLRVPLPLVGQRLRNLLVTPSIPDLEAHVEIQQGRLEVRTVARGDAEITIQVKIKFTAGQESARPDKTLTKADEEIYLRPREGWISVTPRVASLAHSLVNAGVPPAQAVRSFWTYLQGNFLCGAIHYDQVDRTAPGDWVLDAGWFDCQLGSALLVSLCRARGIPARLMGGRLLYPLAPTQHYWAEAWMEGQGWMPADLLSWDLSRGGRDAEWRDHFFGRLDLRMTTECLPRQFTGAPGIPVPKVWTLLQSAQAGGLETRLMNSHGVSVYTDTVRMAN